MAGAQDDHIIPPLPDDVAEAAESWHMTDAEIAEIVTALDNDHDDVIVAALAALSAADTAELLAKVHDEDREKLLTRYASALPAETFSELAPELQRQALRGMSAEQVARLIGDMDSDDALYIIESLDPDFQREIIRKLSARMRISLEEGLAFPARSAGRLMQREFVAIPQFWTVGKTIDYMRAANPDMPEEFFDVFVVSPAYKIVGAVPLSRILRSQRPMKIESLADHDIITIPATMDQEEVASIFRREDLISAPVVDADGRLIGVITIDDVVDVIDEEATEDLLKLGGVDSSDIYHAVFSTAQSRFFWLFLNCFTALLAAGVISLFDATLEQLVALAILMPIVAGMGGNAGTQALAVAVRALAMGEVSGTNAMRLVVKEGLVGLLNGAMFATIIGFAAALWFSSVTLGLVIGSAMIINLFTAGVGGSGIPILLHKMGADPAVSSAIFLTAITDVIGFFAFLGLATIFLL